MNIVIKLGVPWLYFTEETAEVNGKDTTTKTSPGPSKDQRKKAHEARVKRSSVILKEMPANKVEELVK